jgi:DNA-directed RNA polymerase subunit RPC12/RpoP
MQDIMVPCKNCSNKVLVSSLKMDLDIGKMVCQECIKNKNVHKEIEQEAFNKTGKEKLMVKSADGESHIQPENIKPTKIGHMCSSCGYKFKIGIETGKPNYCPYCNERVLMF